MRSGGARPPRYRCCIWRNKANCPSAKKDDLAQRPALHRRTCLRVWLPIVLYDEELDDGVHILVDVGGVGSGDEANKVLRVLMEVNPELSPAKGESVGLDGQTGDTFSVALSSPRASSHRTPTPAGSPGM